MYFTCCSFPDERSTSIIRSIWSMPAPQRTFTWSKMIHTNPLDLYVLQAHHRGVLKPFSLVKYIFFPKWDLYFSFLHLCDMPRMNVRGFILFIFWILGKQVGLRTVFWTSTKMGKILYYCTCLTFMHVFNTKKYKVWFKYIKNMSLGDCTAFVKEVEGNSSHCFFFCIWLNWKPWDVNLNKFKKMKWVQTKLPWREAGRCTSTVAAHTHKTH